MPTFYGAIDLSKNELRNAVIQNLGSAPSSPSKGQMYFNSADNTMYWWDGSQWIAAKAAAGAVPAGSVTTQAVGDAPVVGVSTNFAREDHKHGREAFGAAVATTSYGLAKADGSAATVARSDHTHGTVGHDQLDLLTAPAGPVNFNGQRLVSVADPTVPTDAANRQYVDNSIAGLAWKDSVKVASTVNGTLATAFANGQNVDGITLTTNDRILIKNQTNQTENGIYTVQAGAPVRAADSATGATLAQATVFVEQGTTQADTSWVCTTNPPIALGTSNIVFVQFGAASSYSAGAGLTLTGNVIDAVAADTTLTINADSMQVNTAVIATQAYVTAALAGFASKLTPTAVKISNYTAAVGELVLCNVSSGQFTITLPTGPADGSEIGVLITASSGNFYMLTINKGASDSIYATPGSTFIYGQGTGARFRYQASTLTWVPTYFPNIPYTPLNTIDFPRGSVNFNNQLIQNLGNAASGTDALNRNTADARYPLLSTLTTKGDIYVATAAGVLTRLGAGADGTALLADSAQASGLKFGPITAGTVNKYATTLTGTASPETITHNLNTRDVHVAVYNGATPYTAVEVDWDAATVNTVTIRYSPNLGAGYRVVVMG